MLVHERMTSTPVTAKPEMTVSEALKLMRERKIRRMPILDSHGTLVGIVSEKDLLYASPSPSTTLSMHELHYLMSKLTLEKVMTRHPVTVDGKTTVEEAARIMADRKIGGLPVMEGDRLAGIITETDIFRSLLEMLGARRSGVRITASFSGEKGSLARISAAIAAVGGDIVGFGVYEDRAEWHISLKVQGLEESVLVDALRPFIKEILDIRTV